MEGQIPMTLLNLPSRAAVSADGLPDVTALITGVGGAAGLSVLKALRSAGIRVVAADCDARSAALELGDAAGVLPRADDPAFAADLAKLALEHGAGVVVCTVAEEMPALHRAAEELADAGVAVWLPSPAAVEDCTDKARFAERLTAAGVPTPATVHVADLADAGAVACAVPGPWIVKPRFGRGSRDVYPCDEPDELGWALRRVPDPLVQTRLTGREFTVDALVDREGRFAGGVPRWRVEVKAGISTKGETFVDERVLDGTAAVLAAVGLRGVACVQGFVTDTDEVVFVETNPRFSGGLSLSLAAGADLVGQYLRAALGLPVLPQALEYRPGVRMSRYFSEVFSG
jgi:carbamoyl-phosphate synthase large subunit